MLSLLKSIAAVLSRHQRPLPQPPPEYTPGIGKGEFFTIGEEFVNLFVELAGLQPDDRVLDVGCGLGRVAGPLTRYLSSGSYEGFDVVPAVVEWCESNLSPLHPGFRFQLANIYSSSYNPDGQSSGQEYRFPFEDNEFDFVFLTSVFTHMLEDETAQYTREIARVLRPTGRVFATFFIVDEPSKELIAQGRTSVCLDKPLGSAIVADLDEPHAAVGYSPEWIRRTLEDGA